MQFHKSKSGSGHICQVIAWTRQQGLVLYIGDRGCSSPTRRWPNRSCGPFGLESAIDFDTPSSMNARRPSKSQGRQNIETKLDRNCTRMLKAMLNKSSNQHPMKQQFMTTYLQSLKLSKTDKTCGSLLAKQGRTHK